MEISVEFSIEAKKMCRSSQILGTSGIEPEVGLEPTTLRCLVIEYEDIPIIRATRSTD